VVIDTRIDPAGVLPAAIVATFRNCRLCRKNFVTAQLTFIDCDVTLRDSTMKGHRMKIIAYYRVSTKRQGRSGLGLEGQRAAVAAFAERHSGKIIAEYTEVESGKRNDRPELAKALGHAKLARATLIVAKLDRLARNVAFLSALMEAGVEFKACDIEHANRLTLHILAAVAEAEAKAISERTTVALKAAKRRGVALGSAREGHWEGREHRRAAGLRKAVRAASEARSKAAHDAYAFLMPDLRKWRDDGDSLADIAGRLNAAGHATTTGKPFTSTAVYRLLNRDAGR
jgi:DNA invertase Pin-like site-specific DNA recombinase